MPVINIQISTSKTVSSLDATTIMAVLTWIETNVRSKLPADTTLTVTLTINP